MRRYPYEEMQKWAAEAGVPYATYIGVISVHEAKTAKSLPDVRRAAIARLDDFLEASPAHGVPPEDLAVKFGLKPFKPPFILYHTRKLLLKRAQGGGGLNGRRGAYADEVQKNPEYAPLF
jgi:hypothetical protein